MPGFGTGASSLALARGMRCFAEPTSLRTRSSAPGFENAAHLARNRGIAGVDIDDVLAIDEAGARPAVDFHCDELHAASLSWRAPKSFDSRSHSVRSATAP